MTGRFCLLALVVLTGCGKDRELGLRYRAERELYQSNREVRRLMIRPELVTPKQWRTIASRYEDIASRHAPRAAIPTDGGSSAGPSARELRLLHARALLSAANLHATVGDSTQMLQLYERVASEFADLPQMAAEVALARGRIDEGKGAWAKAASAYQVVVDKLEPQPGEPGVAGAVVDLPLQIARLQTKGAAGSPEAATRAYEDARARYETWIAAHPGSRLELDSRAHVADLAADRGDWKTAARTLRALETKILASPKQERDPAGIRFATAAVQSREEATADSSRTTLLSLAHDYPKSPFAPQALLALANQTGQRGQVEEALAYLNRLRSEYPQASQFLAEGQLVRGRLLEQHNRWPEALAVFRSLPLEQPVSEPALRAPLEVVNHYTRVKDQEGLASALKEAESHYRDFLTRYPPGPSSLSARTGLVQTLYLQKHYDEAVSLLVELGESQKGAPQGAKFLLDAARMAYKDMKDSTAAADILERTGKLYANTEMGRWASTEAARLRDGAHE